MDLWVPAWMCSHIHRWTQLTVKHGYMVVGVIFQNVQGRVWVVLAIWIVYFIIILGTGVVRHIISHTLCLCYGIHWRHCPGYSWVSGYPYS